MIRYALLACALLACAAFPRPAAADDTLNIVAIYPSAFFEVLDDVAENAGLFKAEHLSVNIQYAGNPAVAVQAVAAGKGDIASVNTDGIILGYAKGVRMTAFLAHGPRFQDVLAVLKASPIHTLGDFRGKVIGETSIGQPGEVFTRVLLAGTGLKEGDYSFAPIGIGAQALATLTTGKIDGIVQPLPQLRIYEVTDHLQFRYFLEPLLGDAPNSAWVTSPEIMQTKGDLLRRFSRAIVKASIITRVNPQLAAKDFLAHQDMRVTDAALADEVHLLEVSQDLLPATDPTSTRIGAMPLRGMKLYTKFLYDNGLTPQLVPFADVVTDQFIGYANDFDHAAFIAQAKRMR